MLIKLLLPVISGGRLGGPSPAESDQWALRDYTDQAADETQTAPQMSLSFGTDSSLSEASASTGPDTELQSRDGIQMQSESQAAMNEMQTETTGLAFRGMLPENLEPCDHSVVHVKEGEKYTPEPNSLALKCYRFIVNEDVHTLTALTLPGATAGSPPPSEYEDKHTFAISVPNVDAAKTQTRYDRNTGHFDVKLFPDGQDTNEVSFAQLDTSTLLSLRHFEHLNENGANDPTTAEGGLTKTA